MEPGSGVAAGATSISILSKPLELSPMGSRLSNSIVVEALVAVNGIVNFCQARVELEVLFVSVATLAPLIWTSAVLVVPQGPPEMLPT